MYTYKIKEESFFSLILCLTIVLLSVLEIGNKLQFN